MPKACIYAGFRYLFYQMALFVGGVMEGDKMWKSNKIAILYSVITLFATFILGQILLILYPDGNTTGSSVLLF